MATRTKSDDEFDGEFEEIHEITQETAEEVEEKSLDGMLAELRGANNVTVNVYRTGKGRHLAFLFTCAPTDYTLGQLQEKLRDEYAGGEFRVHVRKQGLLVANQIIAVEAPKTTQGIPAPISAPVADNGMASLLVAMQENTRTMMMALQDSQNRQQENMMNLMTTLFSSVSKREQPQQSSVAELLGLLATSKNLFDSGEKVDSFEMFQKGLEFAQHNNGERNPLTALVDSMGPAVVALAEQVKAAPRATIPQGAPIRPAPVAFDPPRPPNAAIPTSSPVYPNPPIESAHPIATPENPPITERPIVSESQITIPPDYQEFAHLLPILLNAAVADTDPEVYANVLLDQVPRNKLLTILGDKNRFMLVLEALPSDFHPYKEWFEELRDITVEIVQEEQTAEDNAGDNSDVSDLDETDENSNGGDADAENISDPDGEPPATA